MAAIFDSLLTKASNSFHTCCTVLLLDLGNVNMALQPNLYARWVLAEASRLSGLYDR